MKLLTGIVLLLALSLVAAAIEPRKRLLIDQVIQVMNIQESLEYQRLQNIDLMRKTLEQQAGEKVHQMYVIRLRNRVMEKYAEYTKELFSWYKLEKRLVAYYDAAFTEAQLKELIAFLKTSTGQALLKSQEELAVQMQQQMVESAQETQIRIDRMIQETIAEVGAEVQTSNKDLHTASPEELERHSLAGDPVAQYLLARAYQEGKGVEKNLPEAIKWFRLSADQGDSSSQGMLGFSYLKGEGVEKDLEQARILFQKSAEGGSVFSAFSIGCMYLDGNGVAKDTKEAFRWFLQAANGGHGPSQYQVAIQYWNGDGVEKKLSEAYAWVLVAIDSELPEADKFKEFMNPYLNSDDVADGMMRSSEIRRSIKARNK